MEEIYGITNYMIFSVSELRKVDFSEVLETSIETIRKSVDNAKTFVKWEGDIIPSSVESLTTKEGPYTIEEMRNILSTPEWNPPIEKEK